MYWHYAHIYKMGGTWIMMLHLLPCNTHTDVLYIEWPWQNWYLRAELSRLYIDITGISEMKRIGMNHFISEKHQFFYCGKENHRMISRLSSQCLQSCSVCSKYRCERNVNWTILCQPATLCQYKLSKDNVLSTGD